jgi:hypothetical protein
MTAMLHLLKEGVNGQHSHITTKGRQETTLTPLAADAPVLRMTGIFPIGLKMVFQNRCLLT